MTAFPLELKSENLGWKAAMYQGNLHIPTHKPSVTEEPRPMFKLAKSSFYDMFSTHIANSKSSVLKRYHCKLRVKLLIEAQKPR